MTQDTKNKMAEILAAAQSKANGQATPNFAPLPTIQPAPTPEQTQPIDTVKPSKMVSFTILWHEGTNEFENREFKDWWSANLALRRIARQHGDDLGYTKTKVCIKWENGAEITDRLDICKKDFWPLTETAGEYLKKCNSVMYQSNLQQGDRINLQWEDEASESEPEPPEPLTADEESQINSVLSEILPQVPEQKDEPKQAANTFKIVNYSDKAFAICTETKPSEEILNIFRLHGSYNSHLKCGKGWIFSKRHLDTIKTKLGL